jgi:phage-related baseplate assembly protein
VDLDQLEEGREALAILLALRFRQRAALFGHNAPDPHLLFNTTAAPAGMIDSVTKDWLGYSIQGGRIDLDASYPKILAGSWVLLAGGDGVTGLPSLPGRVELYRADKVKHLSRLAFGMSGRITAITPDTSTNLTQFQLDEALVFAQSEEVALAKRPLAYPLYGTTVSTGRVCRDLMPQQSIAVSGRRQRVRIIVEDANLEFVPDGESAVPIKPNDSFMIATVPAQLVGTTEVAVAPADLPATLSNQALTMRWRLIDRDGLTGTLDAPTTAVELQPALSDDPVVRELCLIFDSDAAITHDRDHTTIELDAAVTNVYHRPTATFCANLARATNGETVSEIAGSGNAATTGQRFMLKQSPLAYVSAATTDGRAATLSVRVDGLLWKETPSLFEQEARAHVYSLRQDNDGRTIVQFGDAVEGARLPTGQDNIRFAYRKFLGSGGNLDAGRLTTLLGRPLGVKAVSNVTAASGGEDAESLDDARRNAPLTMLTLGRAVSLQDYTDFARSFAGIDKAQATWAGSGAARGIFVTVAGPDGAAVADDSETMVNLVDALRDYGDPLVPLTVRSFTSVFFKVSATIKVADDADEDTVLADVETALHEQYAFGNRDFGQTVSIDEVMAVIHTVTGVVAADVDLLYRTDPGATPDLVGRLFAFPAQERSAGTIAPSELTTLHPDPVTLGVRL